MESHWYILIEIGICFIVSFFLVWYYSRRGTNLLALFTAGFTWWLNFILIVLIPYDIYYTYSEKVEESITEIILNVGYNIIYWTLFICSWIFIPLMQEYEDSGDFTKKRKFFRSIKNNLIYYGILAAIGIVFVVIVWITSKEFSFIYSLMNCSYLIGLLLFYFLFGYSIINLPLKTFYKANYEKQIKYLEWRVIDFKNNLDKIKKELVDDGYLLQSTLENFNIMKRVNKSKSFEDDKIEEKSEVINRNDSLSSSVLEDYADIINERYNYLYDNAKVFGIDLRKNSVDNDKEPLNKVEELIKLNRKINKNEWDNLRIQIRIRNQYKHWLILSTILQEIKNENNNIDNISKDKNVEIEQNQNEEGLIPSTENSESEPEKKIVEEGFIPYKNISNFTIFYYNKLKRPLLYIYLSIIIIGGSLTLISQIGAVFNFSLYGVIVKAIIKDISIFRLHFFIMIPIIFLFIMSIYTFFKIKLSGYFYMYKNRQTDSVTLMYFSTNLCRISFSICLDFILNINVEFNKNNQNNENLTKIQKILNFDDKNRSKLFFSIYKYSPLILGVYVIILIFKVPQRIAKLCGKKIFQTDSDDSMSDIMEGHEYFMKLNKKYNGETIPKENLILPEDKYNKS